jgi:hypothetical protein
VAEAPQNRSRAIANTVMSSIFFVMAVLVTVTRASWWATIVMGVISLWALGAVIVNVIAIKTGLPPLEEAPPSNATETEPGNKDP